MKHLLKVLAIVFPFTLFSQVSNIPVHTLDPYNPASVKGEIIIKIKDNITINVDKSKGYFTTGLSSLDNLFHSYNPGEMSKVFKETKEIHEKKPAKNTFDLKGNKISSPALFNIYKLKFNDWVDTKEVLEKLKSDSNIVYAEPNYLVYTVGNDLEINNWPESKTSSLNEKKGPIGTHPNDPYYANGSQEYLNQINAPLAWDLVTGDTNQIIAIIDTGVDWDHPDLNDNIWINKNELPTNGIDDDNNGYIDDYIGWDFVNMDANPGDDNSHGTHVAGIAAAEGNNGTGICGVAWHSKILPLKVLQSTGTGSSSNLAEAIEYAANQGATVINMSLGSYGESLTVRNALENAYAGTGDGLGSMLVAAAGNDHLKVSAFDLCGNYGSYPMPFYPAAYPWVLGVMAGDAGPCNGFSNWDFDGPVAYNGANYELITYGTNILSCKLNGEYWHKSGTSMAAPIVAGAVALMRQYQPEMSGETIFAKLIQGSTNGNLDILNSITKVLSPQLIFVSSTILDNQPGCDNDGIADAGETVHLYLTIMNAGGHADSVWVKLRLGEFEDPSIATINDSTSTIGDISAYSILTGELSPFEALINQNAVNNREIIFEYELGYGSISVGVGEFTVTIQKGVEIGGVITSNMTLTPNNLYLLSSNLRVSEEACLTILPGTTIKFYPGKAMDVRGKIIAIGKPDSLIVFESADENHFGDGIIINNYGASDTSEIQFCEFYQLNYPISLSFLSNGRFAKFYDNKIYGCKIKTPSYNGSTTITANNSVDFKRNLITENFITLNFPNITNLASNTTFRNNVFINNLLEINQSPRSFTYYTYSNEYIDIGNEGNTFTGNFLFNRFTGVISNEENAYVVGQNSVAHIPNYYWGRTDSLEINKTIYDFDNNVGAPSCIFNPVLEKPASESHGMVWKVNINDVPVNKFDFPYNSPDGLGIVGAETLKFDVFFNRAMDISFPPLLTFGVREPYTQHIVADTPAWSEDSTVYTAYFTTNMTTGDGMQRIRVSGAKDNKHFLIPTENKRFEFVIQAASAASVNFYATAGIGKVDLGWPSTASVDILGYNLYRFVAINDSTNGDTLRIHDQLILDTIYTDYNVEPGKTYNYLYSTLGTNMSETDYSKKVTATPFSASPGDANGDQSVNILDITTIVGYILNQNPQPFLLEAADVNDDGSINLLDIIGVVNLVMGGKAPGVKSNPALAYLEPGQILFESDGTLTGFQFQLIGTDVEQLSISPAIAGFEFVKFLEGDTLNCILFSLNNQLIPAGRLKLFNLSSQNQMPDWGILFAGNAQGDYVPVNKSITSLPEDYRYDFKVYPNPGNGLFTIEIESPETAAVQILLFDKLGRQVFNTERQSVLKGLTNIPLDLRNSISSEGLHFLIFQYGKQSESGLKYRKVEKLLIIR